MLASGTMPFNYRLTPPVAENLGVSIPTLYRWVPASSR